ncbi:MAG TPA: hypothetical protein VGD94_07955 [Vicinamibacterales bacterium]
MTGFDTLLARHPDPAHRIAIQRLEQQLVDTVRHHPEGVIDERILSQQVEAREELIKQLLVELVGAYVLRTMLFWQCPNGRGAVDEQEQMNDFPLTVECDRCHEVHHFHVADVDVKFLPTDRLLNEVGRSR